MFEEEYFVSLLFPSSSSPQPSEDFSSAFFYKYFSALSPKLCESLNASEFDQRFTEERGNVMGVSLPN